MPLSGNSQSNNSTSNNQSTQSDALDVDSGVSFSNAAVPNVNPDATRSGSSGRGRGYGFGRRTKKSKRDHSDKVTDMLDSMDSNQESSNDNDLNDNNSGQDNANGDDQSWFGQLQGRAVGTIKNVGTRLAGAKTLAFNMFHQNPILFVLGIALGSVTSVGLAVTVGSFIFNQAENYGTLWVGTNECVDYIQQAKKKDDDHGEIVIPPPNSSPGFFTITGYGPGGWVYANGSVAAVASGTGQEAVHNAWVNAGCQYKEGVATLNGLYLVAMTEKFGEPGEVVTCYFDGGGSIDCILADSKSSLDSDCNEWGHDYGQCVLEFEVDMSYYHAYGNPGTPGFHGEWANKRVGSVTKHGMYPGIGVGGVAGGAVANLDGLGNDDAASAMDECEAEQPLDNGTIAAALCAYSYSQRRTFSDGCPGTMIYDEVWKATINDEYYRSCDRGVAAAIKWCGADDGFEYGGCANEHAYMESSPLWEKVGSHNFGGDAASNAAWATENLEPGDILCTAGNLHTFAYVGEEAVQQAYEQLLSGSGSAPDGANVGAPEPGAVFVSASIGSDGSGSTRTSGPGNGRAPCIQQVGGDARDYDAFRYVGNYQDKDKYSNVGKSIELSLTSSKDSKCECVKEPDDDCGEQMARKAVSIALCEYAGKDGWNNERLWAEAPNVAAHVSFGGFMNEYTTSASGHWLYHDGAENDVDNDGSTGGWFDHDYNASGNPYALYGWEWAKPYRQWMGDEASGNDVGNLHEINSNAYGWYACCSPWCSGMLQYYKIVKPREFSVASASQANDAMGISTLEVIPLNAGDKLDEVCKPGDILNIPLHTWMYVGNDIVRERFPDSDANIAEEGQRGQRYLGLARQDTASEGTVIIRAICPDSKKKKDNIARGEVEGAIQIALQQEGKPYVYGASGPDVFDCSGLVWYAFTQAGLDIPRAQCCGGGDMISTVREKCGGHLITDASQLKRGDLLFYDTGDGRESGHVALYLGNNQRVHANGSVVTVDGNAINGAFIGGGPVV